MPHRSHKRWKPAHKAGEIKAGDQFVNPWPQMPSGVERKENVAGARRSRANDIAGKPLAKAGEPYDA